MRPCACNRWVPGHPFLPGRDCRLCYLYNTDPAYQAYWDGQPEIITRSPLPTYRPTRTIWRFLGQIVSYTEAVVKWKLAGSPVTPPEELAHREFICKACPRWYAQMDGCRICGCGTEEGGSLKEKRAMATEACPDTPPRWPAGSQPKT